jgi:adenosylcobinamide-phosphate synthase
MTLPAVRGVTAKAWRSGAWRSGAWQRAAATGAGLLVGAALDAVLGDPRRGHPVAAFGALAGRLERRMYGPSRRAGLRYMVLAVGVPTAAAAAVSVATRHRPVARGAAVALATWTALGGTSLRREAGQIGAALTAGDLAGARDRLPHLCGRDPAGLDAAELARATVESVAENTSDAVVAPLCWGALAGLPGLVGYRVVNTLDAMVGNRSPRYERFGSAAAHLDDLANLAPSRLTAALTVAAARRSGGDPRRALRTWLRYGMRHPSPNAGQCEAAMAGALGVRLGGRIVCRGRVEERPTLGAGPGPEPAHIRQAARLSALVGVSALALTVGHAVTAPARRALLRRAAARLARRYRRNRARP